MSNVISIAAVRAKRLRESLAIHGRDGEMVIIETRTRTITAVRIVCRELFAEVLDGFGDYFVLDYNEIRSMQPATVAQTSVVNARGEFLPVQHPAPTSAAVAIIPFTRRQRRK
ncbi:hypothetical protein [Pseudorhodoplanes sp.]|uniref:hypothetical protein n=1 Tax=Pseudorhodoplanes sp. TaxID=1934341 RepID=UPI002BB205CF|nr:hypothetical protein [Pseudorhodoplanes sp.]HWV52951.1 hypothetical protein [Pseudorhodoplanes sp.]